MLVLLAHLYLCGLLKHTPDHDDSSITRAKQRSLSTVMVAYGASVENVRADAAAWIQQKSFFLFASQISHLTI